MLGFTPEEQRLYFKECLAENSQALDSLLEKIKESPMVQSICYLRLNAAFVVHTFKSKAQCLPATVYEIYLSVILNIISRHCEKQGTPISSTLTTLEDISRSSVAGRHFKTLCEVAYRGVLGQ